MKGTERPLLMALSLAVAVTAPMSAGVQPLSARRIPAQPELSIRLPIAVDAAARRIERALVLAGIPCGVEEPVPHSAPTVVPTLGALSPIRLSGQTVGDVLDALVQLDPRYRWSESDGRILIRPRMHGEGPGLLDRRIPPVTLRHASMMEALELLSRLVLTPHHQLMRTYFAPKTELVREPVISVNLANPTLLEALNTISRAAGAFSWEVGYRNAGAGPDSVTLSFMSNDLGYTAFPPGGFVFEPKKEKER